MWEGTLTGIIGLDGENIVAIGANDNDLVLEVNRIRELNRGVMVVLDELRSRRGGDLPLENQALPFRSKLEQENISF